MNIVKIDKTRKRMAMLFEGVGVEVGVADGFFAKFILDRNEKVAKLYGVDIYKPHEGYADYRRLSTYEGMVSHAEEVLTPFGGRHQFVRKFSMDAVKDFEDESLDFVYIDANHDYKHVTEDIIAWSKKVRKGGIVSGDDYKRLVERGDTYKVIEAVNDYVRAHPEIHELILYEGGNTPTNWMFIKP